MRVPAECDSTSMSVVPVLTSLVEQVRNYNIYTLTCVQPHKMVSSVFQRSHAESTYNRASLCRKLTPRARHFTPIFPRDIP